MKNLLFIFIVLATSTAHSQDYSEFEFPMAESSLLWEISGHELKEPSYLFGTIHVISAENYFFPDTLDSLLSHSDALMMEIDLNLDPAGLMDLITLKEGTIHDFFTEPQMDSLLTWAEINMGASKETLDMVVGNLKPFALSLIIENIELLKVTMDGPKDESDTTKTIESYEMNLSDKAKEYSLSNLALETIEEQISFFDELPNDIQAESVMSAIRGDSTAHVPLEEYYLTQDVDAVYNLIDSLGGLFSDQKDIFLTQRNQNWIPKIELAISAQKTFIAVGAGHLGGPNGVIRLLQRAGYTLKPIRL